MNCSQTHLYFDDLLDQSLPAGVVDGMNQHLALCPVCRQDLEQERGFRQLLRQQPVPPPSPGFASRAFRQAASPPSQLRGLGFAVGFSSALAAVLVAWLTVGVLFPVEQAFDAEPDVTLTLQQKREINLVFNAPQEFPGATLTMLLPDFVDLDGHADRRELSWKTTLRAGQNLLTLPIVANDVKDGELIAKLAYGGEVKTFRLRLKVVSPRVFYPNRVTHEAV